MQTLLRATMQRLGLLDCGASTLHAGAAAASTALSSNARGVSRMFSSGPPKGGGGGHDGGCCDGGGEADEAAGAAGIGHPELADVMKANRRWTVNKLAEDPL